MSATGTTPFFGIYSGDMANKPTISWGDTGGISTPVARNFQIMKMELKRNATIKRLTDPNGQMAGYHKRFPFKTMSVEMVVRAAVASGVANAAIAASLQPIELSKITLAKLISATDAIFNGEWIYEEGAENSLAAEEETLVKFEMFQFYTDAGVLIAVDTILAPNT